MGPLKGIKVVELAGIGPGPMCAMLLADLGADVIRVDRLEATDLGLERDRQFNLLNRGRPSVSIDLKKPEGIEAVLRLIDQADALIEGFRPGVMEKLGLGPDVCLGRNPKLVYGRMTGWGQDGPLAHAAGHDINYIALTGALHAIGDKGGPPVPPLNLVGDFGGGAMYLAFGICAGLVEALRSGQGQVVDAAMTDGASSLMTAIYGLFASGDVTNDRGSNVLDSGAHYYGVYQCADGRYVSVGSLEGKFYAELLEKTGLVDADLPDRQERQNWDGYKERLAAIFKTKTRDEWSQIMEGSDVCFAPVLDMDEAPRHPHNVARGTFVDYDGVVQPAPAPRFGRTPGGIQRPPASRGENTEEALTAWGFRDADLDRLRVAGAIK
ncbi:MAG: alpha-methylacyl-CoA racemase [Acidimicrobiia bacterium]|jgi:alpha-methylacyl-CoA racemase|nr:alpha-methylacyl-CoA racemase [Acidimicrobiia bacterium]